MRRIGSQRKFTYPLLIVVFLLLASAGFGYYRYSRPIDPPVAHVIFQSPESDEAPDITWPPAAQASIGTVEDGILASKPNQTPKPTASTAKVITVLTVLKEKPLALGEKGPLIPVTQRDIDIYNAYYAANGSLVAVRLGEQLSQYQMLQGILIRSGNNLADSLAIWAFGSLEEYQKAAQKLVDELGMKDTTVGTDASGLSTSTISTAEDLTRLGIAAMKHDVVREIVRQPSSSFPADGVKPNTNWMLGQNGVVGIKTGSLPAIGGVFMIASEYTPESEKPITIVGAVQGEPTTYTAISRAGQLAETIKPLFITRNIIQKGEIIAHISTPWGEQSDVVAENDMTLFGWKYAIATPNIHISRQSSFQKGEIIGQATVGDSSVNLIANETVGQPSLKWRLLTNR